MTDSQLRDLLELGARTDEPAAPPGDLFARAVTRRRRHRLRNAGAFAAAAAVLSIGGASLASGGLPFRDATPAGPVTVSYAGAPQCVRDVLARARERVVSGPMSAVVVDIPATKSSITQGITSGSGWRGIGVVEVLAPVDGVTPSTGFTMWEGIKPVLNLQPGRSVALVTLDRSPKPPADDVGEPIWIFDAEARFPVRGDLMTVTCPDGTSAALPWRDSVDTWLAPNAPMGPPPQDARTGSVPEGSTPASTDPPTTAP